MQRLHLRVQLLMLVAMVALSSSVITSCNNTNTQQVPPTTTTIVEEEGDLDELIALNEIDDVNQQTVELEDFSNYLDDDVKNDIEEDLEPIPVTEDDNDLRTDSDDLPEGVEIIAEREVPKAYYYGEKKNILDDPNNTAKGVEVSRSNTTVSHNNAAELFFVVAGAFRTAKNAQKKINRLENLGFKPQIIQFSDSEFQTVCVGKFKIQKDADSIVTELTEEHNLDAYVVKRRQ